MRAIAAILLGLFLSSLVFAEQTGRTFPFTREQNQDGARYVWFLFDRAGLSYDYVPARELPESGRFLQVFSPRTGDLASWPEFVAIIKVDEEKQISYLTAEGERGREEIEDLQGEPVFYRFVVRK